jgi:hypothetical protein
MRWNGCVGELELNASGDDEEAAIHTELMTWEIWSYLTWHFVQTLVLESTNSHSSSPLTIYYNI